MFTKKDVSVDLQSLSHTQHNMESQHSSFPDTLKVPAIGHKNMYSSIAIANIF